LPEYLSGSIANLPEVARKGGRVRFGQKMSQSSLSGLRASRLATVNLLEMRRRMLEAQRISFGSPLVMADGSLG
jgi:hypothetical protein